MSPLPARWDPVLPVDDDDRGESGPDPPVDLPDTRSIDRRLPALSGLDGASPASSPGTAPRVDEPPPRVT